MRHENRNPRRGRRTTWAFGRFLIAPALIFGGHETVAEAPPVPSQSVREPVLGAPSASVPVPFEIKIAGLGDAPPDSAVVLAKLPPLPPQKMVPPTASEIAEAFAGTKLEHAVLLTETFGEKAGPCIDYPWIGPIFFVQARFKVTVYYHERADSLTREMVKTAFLNKAVSKRCEQKHTHGSPFKAAMHSYYSFPGSAWLRVLACRLASS